MTDPAAPPEDDAGWSLLDWLLPLAASWKTIVGGAFLISVLAFGVSWLITPTFTARTSFLPPQGQQSAASAALSQLGSLSGLAGAAGGLRTQADQFVALMQSSTVADRLIDQHELMKVHGVQRRTDARKRLAMNTRITLGKRDGIISIEVDDTDRQRAADIANSYVDELRRLTNNLAITEAQVRRAFFENELKKASQQLSESQRALEQSGFSPGALKAEPRAAAESYAKLRAEVSFAELRLQTLSRTLQATTPEVQQQLSILGGLRAQLARAESSTTESRQDSDYISRFRSFKYHETLFDLLSRQYEMARLDESRDSALVQVIDRAEPPELKSRPRRAINAIVAGFLGLIGMTLLVLTQARIRSSRADPETARKLDELNRALVPWR
jgi:uncharacterized protein involved in exopolysaccharide biosynthesis